jgi:hypothetical protein
VPWAGVHERRDASGRRLDAPFELDGQLVRGPTGLGLGPREVGVASRAAPSWLVPAAAPQGALALGTWREPLEPLPHADAS